MDVLHTLFLIGGDRNADLRSLALRFEDVTPEGLRIRHAKFQKSRLLALHPSTQAGLERYLQRRRRHGGNDGHIFISVRNHVLHCQTVRDTFQALMGKMGLQCEPARQGSRPRIHDLRHSWAVRALQACPPVSDSVRAHALAVSTYLGHAGPSSTFVYLHTTAQLLADIADRSERFARGARS